jgi:hypothetical protein
VRRAPERVGFFGRSAATQDHRSDFGGAVEPEGNSNRADATVDVELQSFELKDSLDIFFSQIWKIHGAGKGDTDLAAVRVAAEHELNRRACRVTEKVVGKVRRMAQEECRLLGAIPNERGNGAIHVGVAFDRVVDACDPNAGRAAIERRKRISENNDVARGERFGHGQRTDGDIVIAEDRIALSTLETAEDTGAIPRDGDGPFARQELVSDEVAREKDRIGAQAVDVVDGFTKKKGLGKSVQVDVAELGNVEAIECRGKIGEANLGSSDFDDVTRDFARVKRQAGGTGDSCGEEAPARQCGC